MALLGNAAPLCLWLVISLQLFAVIDYYYDSLAEWSKALASGASPQGRGLEPHSCQLAHKRQRAQLHVDRARSALLASSGSCPQQNRAKCAACLSSTQAALLTCLRLPRCQQWCLAQSSTATAAAAAAKMTVLPSGLRRWLQAPVRKGMGSNPRAVRSRDGQLPLWPESYRHMSAIISVQIKWS